MPVKSVQEARPAELIIVMTAMGLLPDLMLIAPGIVSDWLTMTTVESAQAEIPSISPTVIKTAPETVLAQLFWMIVKFVQAETLII